MRPDSRSRISLQHRTEAERILKEFRERLAKFGLELHPDKTRLIEFGRFAARDRNLRGEGKPETFTFLGFTHCGQRHKSGTFTVWRITAKKRMVAKLKAIKVELQRRRHDRMAEVGAWLRKVVLGYYQYHAVPGNTTQLRIRPYRDSDANRDPKVLVTGLGRASPFTNVGTTWEQTLTNTVQSRDARHRKMLDEPTT
jgi:hypothetical protein